MTKKKTPQNKKVAPKATYKAKGSSSKAQPKKTSNNRKWPASDDETSSDKAPEKPHVHSCKKAKKGLEPEVEFQVEEDEVEEISDSEGGGTEDDDAENNKVS